MAKLIKKISETAGHMPGELIHVGERKIDKASVSVIDYDEKHFQEKAVTKVEELFKLKDTSTVTWININGLHELDIIEKIGSNFGIHSLTLEDIVNTGQRPKYEDFEGYIFIVLNMLMFNDKEKEITSEQVSLVLGPNFVISFQERPGDVFDAVRSRIRSAKGRIRKMGPDYLAYSLLDAVVDNYFMIMEKLGEKIEGMEEELIADPTPRTMRVIHNLKRDTIFLRKSIWPLREVAGELERGESSLIAKETKMFLRDIYDHTIQVIDTIETFRDIVSGMLDIYLSSVSNRLNEVMKVLTVIATIFIPITFIAGVYGMNFNTKISPFNMPELNWPFGYAFAWGIMIFVAAGMIAYFKRKKWF